MGPLGRRSREELHITRWPTAASPRGLLGCFFDLPPYVEQELPADVARLVGAYGDEAVRCRVAVESGELVGYGLPVSRAGLVLRRQLRRRLDDRRPQGVGLVRP